MTSYMRNMLSKRRVVAFALLLAGLGATSERPLARAYDPNVNASCLNDVGRGALIWGSSGEVTTYSPPYVSLMTPEIYQIPVSSRTTTQTDAEDADLSLTRNPGDPNDRLTESGTIFGSDGNIYEYHYVRGIEPRKVVDLKREETKPGVWVDHYVARIVYEPVLIRVLRPAGSNRQDALDAARAAARANDGTTPDPCAPATEDSTKPSETKTLKPPIQGVAEAIPPVEGDPQKTPPSKAKASSSARTVTPEASSTPGKAATPVLVLPDEYRLRQESAKTRTETTPSAPAGLRTLQGTPLSPNATPPRTVETPPNVKTLKEQTLPRQ